jgi:2-beta-glucuronyltransferase
VRLVVLFDLAARSRISNLLCREKIDMKFVMIAGHQALAPRKVGFHFWSEHLTARGDDVYFIAAGQSYLSLLKSKSLPSKPYNRWVLQANRLFAMSWIPPFSPCLNYPVLNFFLLPLFSLYFRFFPRAALLHIQDADYIVVESGPGLVLIPLLARACPAAKIIYEVSDRLVTVGAHPTIIRAEQAALPYCNLIRVPALVMVDDFALGAPVWYSPQGLNKSDFDEVFPSPYLQDKNAVSIGDMLFDAVAIIIMATHFSDWTFHIFGRNAKLYKSLPNVIEYGECPITELTKYIQHANIGLAPYKTAPNCEYLSQSSLKMIQYTYCQLPIVAPNFAAQGRPHVLAYETSEKPEGVIAAFNCAINFDRASVNATNVLSWGEMFENMLGKANQSIQLNSFPRETSTLDV